MNRAFLLRILINTALLVSLLWWSWFLTVAIAVILSFRFRAYEIIAWGVVGDLLYATSIPFFAGLPIFFTFSFVLLFLFAQYCKRFLVFYY